MHSHNKPLFFADGARSHLRLGSVRLHLRQRLGRQRRHTLCKRHHRVQRRPFTTTKTHRVAARRVPPPVLPPRCNARVVVQLLVQRQQRPRRRWDLALRSGTVGSRSTTQEKLPSFQVGELKDTMSSSLI
jgi:hypothetical protein